MLKAYFADVVASLEKLKDFQTLKASLEDSEKIDTTYWVCESWLQITSDIILILMCRRFLVPMSVRFRFGWNRFECVIKTSNRFDLVVEVFFHGLSVGSVHGSFGSVRHKLRSGVTKRNAMIKRQDQLDYRQDRTGQEQKGKQKERKGIYKERKGKQRKGIEKEKQGEGMQLVNRLFQAFQKAYWKGQQSKGTGRGQVRYAISEYAFPGTFPGSLKAYWKGREKDKERKGQCHGKQRKEKEMDMER